DKALKSLTKVLRDRVGIKPRVDGLTSEKGDKILEEHDDRSLCQWVVCVGKTQDCIVALNSSVRSIWGGVSRGYRHILSARIATTYLRAVCEVEAICSMRDSNSKGLSISPPAVRPLQLYSLDPLKFAGCIDTYSSRFLTSHSRSDLDTVNSEFRRLISAIEFDEDLKVALKAARKKSFEESWQPLDERAYIHLKTFCSGMATVMPTSSLVESDFSLINFIRDATASRILTLTLEGVLHSKQ
ncbi:hypothetical protein KIPB_014530, partial [Kipferlia bialata]